MGTMRPPRAPGLFTVEDYHSFLETRPDDERWQLIDGVAVMMTPPTLVHQKIARNLCNLLDDVLELRHPKWAALQEIGLIVPGYDEFRPKADAAVLDSIVQDTSYATRFYLVAEIRSDTNTDKHIALKRVTGLAGVHRGVIQHECTIRNLRHSEVDLISAFIFATNLKCVNIFHCSPTGLWV